MNAIAISNEDDRPLWLGAASLRRLLTPAAAIEALEAALRAAGPLAATGHAALACDVEGGVFHVKTTALAAPRRAYVAKINANFPANRARGLPTIQGVAALFDATDGRLLALLDSPELTAARTGAATAVAARRLARPDASRLLTCGAGRQAFAQVACLAAVRSLATVWVFDLESDRAMELARRLAAELGVAAHAVDAVAPSSLQADLVVTCTTARSAFLRREHVAPGAFVAAVGSDHPSKQELVPELVAATRCFVDSLDQALACGELHHAVAAGAMRPADVAGRLDELVRGTVAGRRSADEITLFDSTGIALEDAAVALAAYERWSAAVA
jgi:ornithine cyclodeaminase/alanine dehydrogenase-like protein (mu-crystallin family)